MVIFAPKTLSYGFNHKKIDLLVPFLHEKKDLASFCYKFVANAD